MEGSYRVVSGVDLSVFQGKRPVLEVNKHYVIAVLEDKSFVVLAQAVRKKPKKGKPQAPVTPEAPETPEGD